MGDGCSGIIRKPNSGGRMGTTKWVLFSSILCYLLVPLCTVLYGASQTNNQNQRQIGYSLDNKIHKYWIYVPSSNIRGVWNIQIFFHCEPWTLGTHCSSTWWIRIYNKLVGNYPYVWYILWIYEYWMRWSNNPLNEVIAYGVELDDLRVK